MAEQASKPAPGNLGDFLNKKKKSKPGNLNKSSSTTAKAESKRADKKDNEDENWEEEQVVAATMKVEAAGKLINKEDEKKDEEDTAAPAWGANRGPKSKTENRGQLDNEKKYPSLAKSMMQTGQVSNIHLDQGKHGNINIETSKNKFAELEALRGAGGGDSGSEEEGPKVIKPAHLTKKKGEHTTATIQREVNRYKKGGPDEEEEDVEEKQVAPREKKKKEKKEKKEEEEEEQDEEEDKEEDQKIQPDLEAAKEKYKHRKKNQFVDLPMSEMREKKIEKVAADTGSKGKKKKIFVEEVDDKASKLIYVDE